MDITSSNLVQGIAGEWNGYINHAGLISHAIPRPTRGPALKPLFNIRAFLLEFNHGEKNRDSKESWRLVI